MGRPVFRLLVMPMLLLASCAAERGGGGPVHLKAENALGPYSGSVCAGDLCFVSGKIGMQDGTFEAEAESAISAVREELARSGLTLRDVLSATVYLTSLDLYHRFNRVYETRFSEPYPARAVVEVSRLPGGARVEIQAVARRSKR